MPSNDSLGRTRVHVSFKRARTLYARILRHCDSPEFAMQVVETYLESRHLRDEEIGRIFVAACIVCPKPSTKQ